MISHGLVAFTTLTLLSCGGLSHAQESTELVSINGPTVPESQSLNRPSQITLCPGSAISLGQHHTAELLPECHALMWDAERNEYWVHNQPIDQIEAEEILRIYTNNAQALGLRDVFGERSAHLTPPRIIIDGVCPVPELSPCELIAQTAPDEFMCADSDGDGTPNSPERCAHHLAYSQAFRALWDAVMAHVDRSTGAMPEMGLRPSPQLRVRLGEALVTGPLSVEVVHDVARRHLNQIQFCYEQELLTRPDLTGRVYIDFTISSTGSVARVAIARTSLAIPRLEQCMVSAIVHWPFRPPTDAGTVRVLIPFFFETPTS